MSRGERPIGAAKGKQSDTEALCHPPPPLAQHIPGQGHRAGCLTTRVRVGFALCCL